MNSKIVRTKGKIHFFMYPHLQVPFLLTLLSLRKQNQLHLDLCITHANTYKCMTLYLAQLHTVYKAKIISVFLEMCLFKVLNYLQQF